MSAYFETYFINSMIELYLDLEKLFGNKSLKKYYKRTILQVN